MSIDLNEIVKTDDETKKYMLKIQNKIAYCENLEKKRKEYITFFDDKLKLINQSITQNTIFKDISCCYIFFEKYVEEYIKLIIILLYNNFMLLTDYYPLYKLKNYVNGYKNAYNHIITKRERTDKFLEENNMFNNETLESLNNTAKILETLLTSSPAINQMKNISTFGSKNKKNYKSAIDDMIKEMSNKRVTIKKRK